MPRNLLFLIACLCVCHPLVAQSLDLAFYHVDTVGGSNDCALPMIYFEEGKSTLVDEYEGDIAYLADILRSYPKMTLRIRTDGLYRRFDNRQRRLNKRRVNRMTKLLKEQGIPAYRIVKIYHQPWVFRSSKPQESSPPLVYRRVICECLWQ